MAAFKRRPARAPFFTPALVLLLTGLPAAAQLGLHLLPAIRTEMGTNPVVFTGALTNTGSSANLYLNNIQVSFDSTASTYLSADPNVFFGNVPGILLPGERYQDLIFAVALAPTTPAGTYSGTITCQGGADIFAANTLASQPFEVVLTPPGLIAARSGNNVVVSWPSPPPNFYLESSPVLLTNKWTAATNMPNLQNGWNQMSLPNASDGQFFRLRHP